MCRGRPGLGRPAAKMSRVGRTASSFASLISLGLELMSDLGQGRLQRGDLTSCGSLPGWQTCRRIADAAGEPGPSDTGWPTAPGNDWTWATLHLYLTVVPVAIPDFSAVLPDFSATNTRFFRKPESAHFGPFISRRGVYNSAV